MFLPQQIQDQRLKAHLASLAHSKHLHKRIMSKLSKSYAALKPEEKYSNTWPLEKRQHFLTSKMSAASKDMVKISRQARAAHLYRCMTKGTFYKDAEQSVRHNSVDALKILHDYLPFPITYEELKKVADWLSSEKNQSC